MDPKTVPWTRIIQSISLVEAIAKLQKVDPQHPMIAVFQPLLIENDENLEQEAGPCHTRIKNSLLPQPTKEVLLDVFLSWIEGKREALLEVLEIRFGGVSPELKEQILKIDSIDSIDRIYKCSLTASKLSEIFDE